MIELCYKHIIIFKYQVLVLSVAVQTGFLTVEDDCITEGEVQEICLRTIGTPEIDIVLDVTVTYNTATPEGETYTNIQD